jgi:hypothetical protein
MAGRMTGVWRGDGKGWQNDWGQNDGGTDERVWRGYGKVMAE